MASNNFVKFGSANPLTADDIDPISSCVGNTFFNKNGIPGSNMQEDFCPRFMGQRCAANFDKYCEAYLYTSKIDQGGFTHINKQFLAETAKKKYCRMDSSAPGSHCATKCESFIPEGQTSVQICETVGTQNWLDTKQEYDLGGNFPQSARLNPISPLYMGYCPEICDAKNLPSADALGPNDQVLNLCIEHGACSEVLMDLAYNVVKNNIPVSNPAFQKIINYAKLDVPINPNIMAKLATTHGLPPTVALDVLEAAKYGGISNHTMPTNLTVETIAKKPVVSPTLRREGFHTPLPQKINSGGKKLTAGVIIVLCMVLLIWFLYEKFHVKSSISYY